MAFTDGASVFPNEKHLQFASSGPVRCSERDRRRARSASTCCLDDHALVKAEVLGFSRVGVEDAVLERYDERTRNTGSADWLLTAGSLAVAFNHPDGKTLRLRVS
jgi:hypothetical protein